MDYRGTLTARRFIGFLTGLLRDVRGAIDLVIDGHPAHVAALLPYAHPFRPTWGDRPWPSL